MCNVMYVHWVYSSFKQTRNFTHRHETYTRPHSSTHICSYSLGLFLSVSPSAYSRYVWCAAQEFEKAGVAGVHIEDQVSAKRCGHRPGKVAILCCLCVLLLAATLTSHHHNILLSVCTDKVAYKPPAVHTRSHTKEYNSMYARALTYKLTRARARIHTWFHRNTHSCLEYLSSCIEIFIIRYCFFADSCFLLFAANRVQGRGSYIFTSVYQS